MPRGHALAAEKRAEVERHLLDGKKYREAVALTGVPRGTVGTIANRLARSGQMKARGKLSIVLPNTHRSWV